jgi:hypothetical protein
VDHIAVDGSERTKSAQQTGRAQSEKPPSQSGGVKQLAAHCARRTRSTLPGYQPHSLPGLLLRFQG